MYIINSWTCKHYHTPVILDQDWVKSILSLTVIKQDLTRLPFKEHLRWQPTRKLIAYRESTHEYYSKCDLPLFYVYPALTRYSMYLSILFLNIVSLLACTHSVDNLFQTLMVLWENENFLTSNLLCFITSVKLCPLVFYFPYFGEKDIRINIFITLQKHLFDPPLIFAFLVFSVHIPPS